MKIIGTSYFDDDELDNILLCENIKQEEGLKIIDFLNNLSGELRYFFKIINDDYGSHKIEF